MLPQKDVEMGESSGSAAPEVSDSVAPFASFKDGCYPRLANLMTYGDMAVFRKFGAMNNYILLSLQSELVELEQRLQFELLNRDRLEKESQEFKEDVDGEFQKFTRNFHLLRNNGVKAAKGSSEPERQQDAPTAVREGKESSSKPTVPTGSERKVSSSKASILQHTAVRINGRIAEIKAKLEEYSKCKLSISYNRKNGSN